MSNPATERLQSHPCGPRFVRTTDNPVRALCCECGTVRVITPGGAGHQSDHFWWELRCVVHRRCATCARVTRHAYLRENDPHADYAEARDHEIAGLARGPELLAEITWLRSCGLIVHLEEGSVFEPGELVHLGQFLDDGQHSLLLNEEQPAGLLLRAVEMVSVQLAVGELEEPFMPWRVSTGRDGLPPMRLIRYCCDERGVIRCCRW